MTHAQETCKCFWCHIL